MDDNGFLIDKLQHGMAVELPVGVEESVPDLNYPSTDFGPFNKAMALGMALTFGTSYATTSGYEANFVSSRLGQIEEREMYMAIQDFLIERWKKPPLTRNNFFALLSRNLKLPFTEFDALKELVRFTRRKMAFCSASGRGKRRYHPVKQSQKAPFQWR